MIKIFVLLLARLANNGIKEEHVLYAMKAMSLSLETVLRYRSKLQKKFPPNKLNLHISFLMLIKRNVSSMKIVYVYHASTEVF